MRRLGIVAVGLALVVGLLICSAPLVRGQPVASIARRTTCLGDS
jgi:hypothetical protein